LPAAAPTGPDATHSRDFAPNRIVNVASATIRDCQSREWLKQGQIRGFSPKARLTVACCRNVHQRSW